MERAYFATGCFWGAERRFWNLPGVVNTSVGYMGGHTDNPTYEDVCKKETNHAETVEVEFDPAKISYQRLLEEFFTMHDPTSLNKQGGDIEVRFSIRLPNKRRWLLMQRKSTEESWRKMESALLLPKSLMPNLISIG